MLLLCYMLSLVTPTGEALKISLYKYNDNKGFSILFYSIIMSSHSLPLSHRICLSIHSVHISELCSYTYLTSCPHHLHLFSLSFCTLSLSLSLSLSPSLSLALSPSLSFPLSFP